MLGHESPVRDGEGGGETVSPGAKELIRQAREAEESARSAREAAERTLKGEEVSEAPEGSEVDTGRVWWDTFVQTLTKGWADSISSPAKASPSHATPTKSKRASAAPTGPRRLYPSGTVSLVPADYVPPPTDHAIIWDGVLGDRQLHVKNFWKHFACFTPTEFNKGIVRVLEGLGRYRRPVWYTPMLASAAPIMVEHVLKYTRQEVYDGEEGYIYLDWAFPELEGVEARMHTEGVPDIPTVMIFPGLAGHSDKDYIRSLCAAVSHGLGWRACVLNWRGFNDAPITKKSVFRPDDVSDMEKAIKAAHDKFPNCLMFAVGFSAGSNQLVKYLGSRKNDHPIAAGVSVCNGFEYECHLKRLEQTTLGHDVYSRGMTYLHQAYLHKHKDELSQIEGFDIEKALAATKHSELDEALVCSLYGYTDVADYYKAIASRPWIPSVTVPLLCIQSADDPLFTEGPVLCREVLPVADLHDNPNIIYFETELGSHLSFVEAEQAGGVSRHQHTFCDRAIDVFLEYVEGRVKKKRLPL